VLAVGVGNALEDAVADRDARLELLALALVDRVGNVLVEADAETVATAVKSIEHANGVVTVRKYVHGAAPMAT
jgi:hypothetical protein